MGGEPLGQRLAFIRGKRGLSQPDLAQLTGLKVQNISRLETAAREHVRSDTLIRLAQALDCSTDYLLGLTDDPTPPKRARRRRGQPAADTEEEVPAWCVAPAACQGVRALVAAEEGG